MSQKDFDAGLAREQEAFRRRYDGDPWDAWEPDDCDWDAPGPDAEPETPIDESELPF